MLTRGKQNLTLHSDDLDFFEFCIAQKPSFNENGEPLFRRIADMERYYAEEKHLALNFDVEKKHAIERLRAGKIHLPFVPQVLIPPCQDS
jgi:hypothetical protein